MDKPLPILPVAKANASIAKPLGLQTPTGLHAASGLKARNGVRGNAILDIAVEKPVTIRVSPRKVE